MQVLRRQRPEHLLPSVAGGKEHDQLLAKLQNKAIAASWVGARHGGIPRGGGAPALPASCCSSLCSLCMFCRLTRIAGPELCKCMHGGALTSGPGIASLASGSRGIASAQPLFAAGYQSPGYGGNPQIRGPSRHLQAAGSLRRSPPSSSRITAAQTGRKMEVRASRTYAQGSGFDSRKK